jgi:hypothetical protein
VFLSERRTGRVVGQIQGGQTGPSFVMRGVPEGEYQLTITARGFQQYAADPFHCTGRSNVNLGRIGLEPCGVLDLEVVGMDGQPIPSFQVLWGGETLPSYRREDLGDGRYRYYDLPLGEVTVEVVADGYAGAIDTLTLEAGQPAEARLVLKRQ